MRQIYADKRITHKKWEMRIEENIKNIYKYDKQCIEFLEKCDITEKWFK